MPLPNDWHLQPDYDRLKEVSELKRQSMNVKGEIPKKERAEALALAKLETALQWRIRKQADEFLKAQGYGTSGKKLGQKKVPGL